MKVKRLLKRKSLVVFVSLFAAFVFTFLTQAMISDGSAKIDAKKLGRNSGNKPVPGYAQGEVLVIFKEGVKSIVADGIASSISAKVEKTYQAISRINGQLHAHLKSRSRTIMEMVRELEKHPDVTAVSPNYRMRIDAVTPNDPQYPNLWGMNNTGQTGGTPGIDINAPDAWQVHTGSSDVIVAVIDTGIDYNHPDLAANMWVNPGEIAGNSTDDDANGYVDDVYGINSITGSGDPLDDNDHGTHCAGTIGGVGNNSQGVAGVNWSVGLMAVKFLDSGGGGWTSDAIECVDYVVDMKTTYSQNIVAINASWGGGPYDATLLSSINAAGTAGIIFCAASGNSGTNNDASPHYPSSYTCQNIMAVMGVDHDGNTYGNYGATSVDIAAPAVGIVSTVRGRYTPQAGDIIFDDMESGGNPAWATGGTSTWSITTTEDPFLVNPNFPIPSPPHFWADSPGVYYANYANNWVEWASDIDLSTYVGTDTYIGFGATMYIENYFDQCYLELSNNSGSSWTPIFDWGNIGGGGYYWTPWDFKIDDSYKTTNFRFRFHLITDYSVTYEGFNFDDIGIGTTVSYGYASFNGTSMATPHVAGAVALLAAKYPGMTPNAIYKRILKRNTPLAALSGLCRTGALLNLWKAIAPPPSLTVTSPNGGEDWTLTTSQTITWTAAGLLSTDTLYIILRQSGVNVALIQKNVDPTTGSYTWTVGDCRKGSVTAGTNSRIILKVKGMALKDRSDGAFTISSL